MKQGLCLLAMVSGYISSLQLTDITMELTKICRTVKPHPEAHTCMDMILFEVFLKSIDWIPQQQITTALFILWIMSLYYLILWNQVDILQKTLQKSSCP